MYLWKDSHLRLSLTKLGAEFLFILLLLGLFAVNTGNNLLYVIFGLLFGTFLVSGWVSRRAIGNIEVQSIEEGNLFARVKGGIKVRLTDTALSRVRSLEVHLEMDSGHIEPGFYPGGEPERAPILTVLMTQAERRGWTRLQALELRTRFPFGFLEKTLRFPLEQEILVIPHPRTLPSTWDTKGEQLKPVFHPGSSSPEGARPYRTGDSLGRMHWKRTAQRGAPWIRTMEDEDRKGLRLRLDLTTWAPGPTFEKELERLSGAVLQSRLQRREVVLSICGRGGTEEFRGHTDAWRALALAQAEGAA